MLNRLGAVFCLLVAIVAGPAGATATADEGCVVDRLIKTCEKRDAGTVTITLEPKGDSSSGGVVHAVDPVCRSGNTVIPCFVEGYGSWNGSCYVQEADLSNLDDATRKAFKERMIDAAREKGLLGPDEKPKGDEGLFVDCTPPVCIDGRDADTIDDYCYQSQDYWAPRLPPAVGDVQDLVAEAVSSMGLTAITLGTTPFSGKQESGKPYVGTIGLPVWLWAEDPGSADMGPNHADATDGVTTVEVDAEVSSVEWDLGSDDIEPIVCEGPGVAYEESFGVDARPDCGYFEGYQQDGEYEVTATSHWDITWEGAGMTGTATLELEDSVNLVLGEVQVLTQ
ncbi:hypothetical protein [Myceligenerans crystallogenes]|uniref:Uncharacterized protein n=1 Tax=Myceligenerans crystallogenes TaxID=316335 RepID=A0ABN2NMK3_9MICO